LKCQEQEYSHLSEVVRAHCGINLHDGKKELVRARLAAPIRNGGFGGVGEYLRHVLADPSGRRLAQMVDSLSTNVTGFFREPRHFEFLANQFLPRLIEAKAKAGNRRIRAWSAGCSTGEEAYSLAITVLEALGAQRQRWDVKILATDISERALDAADAALYPRESVRDVPPASRAVGFAPSHPPCAATHSCGLVPLPWTSTGSVEPHIGVGPAWEPSSVRCELPPLQPSTVGRSSPTSAAQGEGEERGTRAKSLAGTDGWLTITPAVRELVVFRSLNLIADWPFCGTFDLIFCRNVMIYFDRPTQERLVRRFWDYVRTGGLLFTGHAESLTGIEHNFRYVEPTIYSK